MSSTTSSENRLHVSHASRASLECMSRCPTTPVVWYGILAPTANPKAGSPDASTAAPKKALWRRRGTQPSGSSNSARVNPWRASSFSAGMARRSSSRRTARVFQDRISGSRAAVGPEVLADFPAFVPGLIGRSCLRQVDAS